MRLTVNGSPAEAEARTLDRLLAELGYEGAHVATAVNEGFVHREERERVALRDGDRIEILAPLQGG